MPRYLRSAALAAALLLLASPVHAEDDAPEGEAEPDEAAPDEWGVEGPYALDVHARIGGAVRLDDPPLYDLDERGGLLVGAGVNLALSRRIAIGLAYEHLDLGAEKSGILDGGVVAVSRDLHDLWLDLALYPLRFDPIGVYVAIAAGLSVQGADMTGSLWSPTTPGTNVSFRCSSSGDPGFAFGAAIGADAVVAGGLRMFVDASLASHRLSDDVLDGCAPGAGTAAVLGLRTGLGYAWDL
jgi:hypothetical protein